MDDFFTFYGDLLGIASAYRLGAKAAYDKLDTFYNTVFGRLEALCNQQRSGIHVQMFSDSVVIWGRGTQRILEELQKVYLDLFGKNLLLRGAIVNGRLQKEPRVEVRNFRKFLPTNDTLARAVGLEKTVKGARLLIEPQVAQRLLGNEAEWLTVEGYLDHQYPNVATTDIRRRICPTPSGNSHELLYFWPQSDVDWEGSTYGKVETRLKELAEFHDPSVAEHLRETVKLVRRSELRERATRRWSV